MAGVFLILTFAPVGVENFFPIDFAVPLTPIQAGLAVTAVSGFLAGTVLALAIWSNVTLRRSALALGRISLWTANLTAIVSTVAVGMLDQAVARYWLIGPGILLGVGMWAARARALSETIAGDTGRQCARARVRASKGSTATRLTMSGYR